MNEAAPRLLQFERRAALSVMLIEDPINRELGSGVTGARLVSDHRKAQRLFVLLPERHTLESLPDR